MDPQQFGEEQSFGDKFKNGLLELIEFVAIVGVIVLVVHFFVAEPHQVSGSSMVPNFHNGEYIITNKISTRFYPIKRGQVLIVHSPKPGDNKVFIKRVIGLPNERIRIYNGKVHINGEQLQEPYLPSNTLTSGEAFLQDSEQISIPDDQYFLIGDNRGGSSDSREWGPVKKEHIIGEAWFRYWPPGVLGLIK